MQTDRPGLAQPLVFDYIYIFMLVENIGFKFKSIPTPKSVLDPNLNLFVF